MKPPIRLPHHIHNPLIFSNKMTKIPFLLLVVLLPLSSATTPLTSAHKELLTYGFPVGLLPQDIKAYSINQTTGAFSIAFADTCRITLPPDNYLASYSKRVTGRIEGGRIAELDGIWVRAFYKWWGITGIRSSGDQLVFEVGLVTAKYPSNSFGSIPQCEGKHSSS